MKAKERPRRKRSSLPSLIGVGLLAVVLAAPSCPPLVPHERTELPGLTAKVRVDTDGLGVPHIEALSLADAFRAQGYLHARDRFFQMDWNRRRAAGRLAELGGSFSHLQSDVGIRLLGLRAAAQRSADALEASERALLDAYAAGVNAWLAANPLPPEYTALEVSFVEPWTALDSLLLGKAFFATLNGPRLWEIAETAVFEEYVDALGEERARLLYPDELGRFAPWVPNATVPDARGTPFASLRRRAPLAAAPRSALELAQRVRARAEETGFLANALARPEERWGSNAWGVAATHSATGGPLVAGDPHLGGATPAIGYEVHLLARNDGRGALLNASGASVPGLPGIVLGGQTSRIAWAVTTFAPDVSDVFRDRLVRDDPVCPARLCIVSAGALHPVEERSETYRLNIIGDGVADDTLDATPIVRALAPQAVDVLRVPFRSFGPVVELEDRSILTGGVAETSALTLQWSALHADRAFRWLLDTLRARDVFEFEQAVGWLTLAGLHHVVADVGGNLAYFAGGEIPLRADLEAGSPLDGMPPWWIRDGSGPANWVPDPVRSQGQVLPFAILPREEMPRIVNPPAGFVVNCNEDPLGFAVDNDLLNDFRPSKPRANHYLGDLGTRGLRNGRVTQMLRERVDGGRKLSLADMKRIQADTRALHAEILVPYLVAAFESARRPGAPEPLAALSEDPRIAEAIARLADWDFSHPTGIPEGYDASDVGGVPTPEVSVAEAEASVAATLYEVWVIKLVKQLNATITSLGLRSYVPINLLVSLLAQDPFTGVGASGVDYFPAPAELAEAADRRDAVFLGILRDALDALPGPAYAAAFAGATDQDDYRWGRLHRIVLPHPLGGSSSIPPAAGFTDLAAGLPGLARDGTWDTVNVAAGPGLPDGSNEWLSTGNVPLTAFRHVHALRRPWPWGPGVRGYAALAGGASENPEDPSYASQLPLWLTVDYHAVPMTPSAVHAAAKRVELFVPAP